MSPVGKTSRDQGVSLYPHVSNIRQLLLSHAASLELEHKCLQDTFVIQYGVFTVLFKLYYTYHNVILQEQS